jgi:menaquinone-specific isochorismate synthase
MPDPEAQFLSLLRHEAAPYLFWRSPEGDTLAAAGLRRRFEPARSGEWREWATDQLDAEPDVPLIVLAFFDPAASAAEEWSGFPPIQYYQPAIAIQQRHGESRQWGDASRLSRILRDGQDAVGASGSPTVDEWDDEAFRVRVAHALGLLQRGKLEKVVLARKARIRLTRPFDLPRTLHAMRQQRHAFSICYSPDGARFFLSATPERLGRVEGGHFLGMALAGTVPSEGRKEGRDLLNDAKEQTEHAYVVRMIGTAATRFATDIAIEEPGTLELPHVTHIMTRISAQLCPDCDLRHVIASLHPTPAVAGTPRTDALALIAALEPFNRGLYAGCVGWFSPLGDGDAAVTIRSAMVCGEEAIVWSGAGIVSDSDAAAEERETRAKMQTMLDILGA